MTIIEDGLDWRSDHGEDTQNDAGIIDGRNKFTTIKEDLVFANIDSSMASLNHFHFDKVAKGMDNQGQRIDQLIIAYPKSSEGIELQELGPFEERTIIEPRGRSKRRLTIVMESHRPPSPMSLQRNFKIVRKSYRSTSPPTPIRQSKSGVPKQHLKKEYWHQSHEKRNNQDKD